jgi:putative intracellular protease/amidase
MKLLLILIIGIPTFVFAQSKTKKIVMVVSSYGKNMGKARPGYEMDEFSQAYLIFKANGLHIDVASPKGGQVVAGQFNKNKPYNEMILADSSIMKMLKFTTPTSALKAVDYDAIYIVGGKGPMFDLVVDPSLQDFIVEMQNKKAVVSAVCHGTIAFANIKNDDKYLLENRLVTGYCNEEETMFGKTAAEFPFLLEDKLKSRGANYQKGEAMLPYMVVDDNFITGQNPYSTTLVAEEIVKSLGKEPVARKKYKDELSMVLVKKFTQGESVWAKTELEKRKDDYDLELIAVYGYYQAMFAKEDIEKIKKGVSIIELATPYYFNEDLYVTLAGYYLKLGDKAKAITTLNKVIQKNPDSEPANSLMNKIKEQEGK